MGDTVIATNRQAHRDYEIFGTIEAGMELRGNEVKSLRDKRANLKDSFARIDSGEVFIYNLHITPYQFATSEVVDPIRSRKLLLHKAQIRRLAGQLSQKGMTLVPLKLYFKKNFVKVELAIAKGKKFYDKREAIKKREAERGLRRALHNRKGG